MTRNSARTTERELRCPICWDALSAPVRTKCGHLFCEGCIRTSIRVKSECPTCRQPILTHRDLRADTQLAELVEGKPASAMGAEISEAPVREESWDCGVCTLCNPKAASRCGACRARRPALAESLATPAGLADRDNSDASEGELGDEREFSGDEGELSGEGELVGEGELSDDGGPANVLVGKRIRVFWKAERRWFKGTVRAYTVDTIACTVYHLVVYDDGDKQNEALGDPSLRWEMLELEPPAQAAGPLLSQLHAAAAVATAALRAETETARPPARTEPKSSGGEGDSEGSEGYREDSEDEGEGSEDDSEVESRKPKPKPKPKPLQQKAPPRPRLAAENPLPKESSLTQKVAAVNPGTRVRLVCSSCGTRCEVFVVQSPKPKRYKVRCPKCKAINDPQLHGSSAKPFDSKRKVRLDNSAPAPFPPARTTPTDLSKGVCHACAESAAGSAFSKAATCFGVSSGAEEAGPRKLRHRAASSGAGGPSSSGGRGVRGRGARGRAARRAAAARDQAGGSAGGLCPRGATAGPAQGLGEQRRQRRGRPGGGGKLRHTRAHVGHSKSRRSVGSKARRSNEAEGEQAALLASRQGATAGNRQNSSERRDHVNWDVHFVTSDVFRVRFCRGGGS